MNTKISVNEFILVNEIWFSLDWYAEEKKRKKYKNIIEKSIHKVIAQGKKGWNLSYN